MRLLLRDERDCGAQCTCSRDQTELDGGGTRAFSQCNFFSFTLERDLGLKGHGVAVIVIIAPGGGGGPAPGAAPGGGGGGGGPAPPGEIIPGGAGGGGGGGPAAGEPVIVGAGGAGGGGGAGIVVADGRGGVGVCCSELVGAAIGGILGKLIVVDVVSVCVSLSSNAVRRVDRIELRIVPVRLSVSHPLQSDEASKKLFMITIC